MKKLSLIVPMYNEEEMIPFPSEETTPPVTKIYFVSTLIINFFAKIVQGERKTKSSLLEILIFRAAACLIQR